MVLFKVNLFVFLATSAFVTRPTLAFAHDEFISIDAQQYESTFQDITAIPILTFAHVRGILATYCVSCHGPGGVMEAVPLTSVQVIFPLRARMFQRIAVGSMPPGRPQFARTQSGRVLLEWLRNGAEFRVRP